MTRFSIVVHLLYDYCPFLNLNKDKKHKHIYEEIDETTRNDLINGSFFARSISEINVNKSQTSKYSGSSNFNILNQNENM